MGDDKSLNKKQFIEDTTIFSAGEAAEEAYLIEDGEVEIKKDEQVIATLGQGEIFGEMALIKNKERSSSAVAKSKATLVIITKDALFQKLEDADPLIAAMIHMFVKRLYKMNETSGD